MTSRQGGEPIRWYSRTVDPPGNLADLRQAVAARPCGMMLESVAQGGRWGRYSIYAWDPVQIISFDGEPDTARPGPSRTPLRQLAAHCRPWGRLEPKPCIPFVGGWIGYLSYEAGRWVEPTARWLPGVDTLPISRWALFDTVLVHDSAAQQWIAAAVDLPPRLAMGGRPPAVDRLEAVQRFGAGVGFIQSLPEAVLDDPPSGRWNFPRDAYLAKVARALDYIRAGDIFQVNLARRFRIGLARHPIALYERLCEANPASQAAYLALPPSSRDGRPQAIVSSSPELFLCVCGHHVTTRPIKGTRPRCGDPRCDLAARKALALSTKDLAELNMIIDLERNDLGRVCEYGSIRVVSAGEIESHPTVFHRTATIAGRLRGDADALDLLEAAFPGGSVTGAPKVRAMQIINELEPHPRGPYCGAIGYIGLDGNMQLSLAIRTMVVTGETSGPRAPGLGRGGLPYGATLHVGSGIVADSDPQSEFEELRAKAAGMLAALGVGSATDDTAAPTSPTVAPPSRRRPAGRPGGDTGFDARATSLVGNAPCERRPGDHAQ